MEEQRIPCTAIKIVSLLHFQVFSPIANTWWKIALPESQSDSAAYRQR